MRRPSLVLPLVLSLVAAVPAQDASTGALRGTVSDASGARVAGAEVRLVSAQTGVERTAVTTQEGSFVFDMLPPGVYGVQVSAPAMATLRRYGIRVEVGGAVELGLGLEVAGSRETVTVSAVPQMVEALPSAISSVLDERAITELPLNGRRFSDLALLTPGVTQDPRSLLRFQWRPGLRRYPRLPDQLPGGRRGRQQRLLQPGARPLSRALPVFERCNPGVSGLLEQLRSGTGTLRQRGDQRGYALR
jgi:carboxypeptidase family protein